jgi:hypothetical protein
MALQLQLCVGGRGVRPCVECARAGPAMTESSADPLGALLSAGSVDVLAGRPPQYALIDTTAAASP